MCDVLHWLPICIPADIIGLYGIVALVSHSVLGCASSYLCDICLPVSDVAARWVLRTATEGELLIPRGAHSAIKIAVLFRL